MITSLKLRSHLMSLPVLGRFVSLAKFYRKGHYLAQTGWFNSSSSYTSVDSHKNPIPWITYSALDFLKTREVNLKSLKVFEYGSGSSTLWWAQHTAHVTAVEHNPEWFQHVTTMLKNISNAEVIFATNDAQQSYAHAIETQNQEFDLVVVDGRNRVECAKAAFNHLSKNGVILWDNTDRPEYIPGIDFLKKNGFRQIVFTGLAPVNSNRMETSLFYRSDNCLEI